jgi:CheY-like chemotaxis protein
MSLDSLKRAKGDLSGPRTGDPSIPFSKLFDVQLHEVYQSVHLVKSTGSKASPIPNRLLGGIHTGFKGKNSLNLFAPGVQKQRESELQRGLPMTRVLLVEDSVDVLYMLQLELEWMGYEVVAAADATSGLEAALGNRPDIIVSDLGMPGVDGFEFIKRVRAIPDLARTPAIALTGTALERDFQQALASGFTAYLVKPVVASDLTKKIDELASRRKKRKAS